MVVEAGGLGRVRAKGTFDAMQRYQAMSQEGLEMGQEPLRSFKWLHEIWTLERQL